METNYIPRELLEALGRPAPPSADELEALDRLLMIARSDTGQSRRVAGFLLSWWNAATCGGFDMTDLWAVDTAIANDMTAVFGLVARVHSYPNSDPFDRGDAFQAVIAQWRPELLDQD